MTEIDADEMANFILRLLKDGEHYDYHCGNCPVKHCGNFEPEERCCWGTIMTWLEYGVE